MISDAILTVLYQTLGRFIDVLPTVGSAPPWTASIGEIVAAGGDLFPVSGMAALITFMTSVLVPLYAWRIFRMFTPGG